MTIDDERLKRLFRGYAEARPPQSRDRCPAPSELAESFEPSASARRKRKVVDHVAVCPACREEFLMLLERHRQDAGSPRPEVRQRWAVRPALWRLAGVALGLILIAASVVVVRQQWERTTVLRSAPTRIVLLTPRAGRSVSGPVAFRWRSAIPSDAYIVELFDDALLPVWTSDSVAETRLVIPLDIMSRLAAGRTYFWMVTGYAGGAKTGESPLGRFTVGD